MKKITYILLLLLALPFISVSKGIKLQLRGGIGTYSMTDLKTIDNLVINQISLPLHQTENFPAYWFFKGALLFDVNEHFSMGPIYGFNSTGSRYSLADYSGKFYYDNMVQNHSVGLSFCYSRPTEFNLNWGVYLDGGINFSEMQLTQHLELTEVEDQQTEKNRAKETGYFVEPGIQISYPYKRFEPGLHIGYHVPLSNSGLKENDSNDFFYLPNGDKASCRWNGIRATISLTIYLTTNK